MIRVRVRYVVDDWGDRDTWDNAVYMMYITYDRRRIFVPLGTEDMSDPIPGIYSFDGARSATALTGGYNDLIATRAHCIGGI